MAADLSFDVDLYERQLREDKRKRQAKARRDWESQKERTRASFEKLLVALGGARCRLCSSPKRLSVHHVLPRRYDVARLSWTQRVKRYWEEHLVGVHLQVLCLSCNGSDGATRVKRLLGLARRQRKSRRR